MTYNPFNKPIGESLDLSDLQLLIDNKVAEGYYVEYKSAFQKAQKISHSLASFANTYGGWYFIGIIANNQTNVAESIPGIDLNQFPNPFAKVRDIARHYIDPMPLLFPQLVKIDNTHGVLVAYVPEGEDPPYITRDGRIYRRAADQSDPIHESNRFVIDRLVERGREAIREFDRFCEDERAFCKAEENRSWVEIYLSPYPKGLISRTEILDAHYLDSLLAASKEPLEIPLFDEAKVLGNVPFNNAQTCVGSVILRQVAPSDVAFNSLELELFVDGRSRIFIPLEALSMLVSDGDIKSRRVKSLLGRLEEQDREMNLLLVKYIDLKKLWWALGYLVAFYLDWLKGLEWDGDLQVKVRLTNVWRCVPFVDLDVWAEHVEKYGLPVCNRGSIMRPAEGEKPCLLERESDIFSVWFTLVGIVGMGLGLPPDVLARLFTANCRDLQQDVHAGPGGK